MDICLCKNYSCPMRDNCLRASEDPNEFWQTYANFELKEDGSCDYLIEINSKGNWKESTK